MAAWTDAELRAYRAAMHDVMERSDALDGEALERAQKLTRAMQERVIGRLHAEEGASTTREDGTVRWNPFWLKRLVGAVEDVARDQAEQYGRDLGEFLPKAFDLGQDMVDLPVRALGHDYTEPRFRSSDLGISANWKPSLIVAMTDAAKDRIGQDLAVSMRTGEPPQKFMKRLAGRITTDGTPFHSVAYRAELITRTEMNRVHDLGNTHRMRQFIRAVPDSGAQIDLLVADVNGWPCDVCSAIAADGPWDADDENVPMLPDDTHPNCRCRKVMTFRGAGAPSKNPTSAERDASVSDTENEDVEEAWRRIREAC